MNREGVRNSIVCIKSRVSQMRLKILQRAQLNHKAVR